MDEERIKREPDPQPEREINPTADQTLALIKTMHLCQDSNHDPHFLTGLLRPSAHPENKDAQIILVGHSRGGIAARAFLQGTSPNRDTVAGLLTTGTPHNGSRMGRIYRWLEDHPRNGAETDEDDWEVVDQLLNIGRFDVRRPVISDIANHGVELSPPLTELRASIGRLPLGIVYGEIAYRGTDLGVLGRTGYAWSGYASVFGSGLFVEHLSDEAATFILDAGRNPADYPGDGLIPVDDQQYRGILANPRVTFVTHVHDEANVLHIDEPRQHMHIIDALHRMFPAWFSVDTP